MAALERIISRVYEDMVAGVIREENCSHILTKSQTEQTALKNRVALNQKRLNEQQQVQADNSRWLEMIKDNADVRELDAITLNRLIKQIVIHGDMSGDTIRQTVGAF